MGTKETGPGVLGGRLVRLLKELGYGVLDGRVILLLPLATDEAKRRALKILAPRTGATDASKRALLLRALLDKSGALFVNAAVIHETGDFSAGGLGKSENVAWVHAAGVFIEFVREAKEPGAAHLAHALGKCKVQLAAVLRARSRRRGARGRIKDSRPIWEAAFKGLLLKLNRQSKARGVKGKLVGTSRKSQQRARQNRRSG